MAESANDNVEAQVDQPQITECTSKGKKLSSQVWLHMKRHTTNGVREAECIHCRKRLCAESKSGTSHLKRHLEKCAARQYHDMKNFCITGSGSASTGSGSVQANQMTMQKPMPSLDAIREAIGVYYISCALPFSQVESAGFKYFMSVVAPQWNPLSRVTIQRDAVQSYGVLKLSIAKELHSAPGRICFTTDNWRSEHNTEEFMCVTAHWIDKNWNLQKRIIKFAALTAQLDGASLADEILLCLGEWKISEKVLTFTLDNASYNDTMVASLRSHLLRKHSLVLHGEFFHLRCSCHIINLVVHAGLKVIDDVILKIRRIVTLLKNSMPKNKKFYEIASTSFGLNVAMKLRLDTPTRWNSTFIMLDRYIYFRDAVDSFVSKDVDMRAYRLTEVEWDKVIQLKKFLKVFYDVTNDFSASKTPTSNLYFHGVWKIHKLLTSISKGPSCILSNMVVEMQLKFEKYWDEYNLLLSCAAVLDPRMKLKGVGFLYEKLFGDVYAKEMVRKIKGTLAELLEEYKGMHIEASNSCNKDTSNNSKSDDFDFDSDGDDLDDFMEKEATMEVTSELDLYLNEKPSKKEESFDLLGFWKSASRFVVLSALARDMLCIPISTVPSESAFSMGKKIISATRSSLVSSTIEALACQEDWLRARGLDPGPHSCFSIGPRVENEEDYEERA